MIKKLFENGYFDYHKFILDNTKTLSLTSTQAIVLMRIIDDTKYNKDFDQLRIKNGLNIRRDQFEAAIQALIEMKLIEIYLSEENGISLERISLDGFFESVDGILNNSYKTNTEDELHSIIVIAEENLGRVLFSNELEMLTSLVTEDRYSKGDFINAFNSLNEKNKSITLRSLTQELSKQRNNPKEAKTPDFVKSFIENIK